MDQNELQGESNYIKDQINSLNEDSAEESSFNHVESQSSNLNGQQKVDNGNHGSDFEEQQDAVVDKDSKVIENNVPEDEDDNDNDNDNEDEDDDDDDVDYDDDDEDGDEEEDEEIDNSFIDEMLEENVDVSSLKQQLDEPPPCKKRKHGHPKNKIETKQKNVLIKRGQDLFEFLPEGWVEITHFSGMPIYLEKKSRVCTTTKPYNLGTGSARKHHIPLSAIPCLQYKTELEKESAIEEGKHGDCPESITPVAKVETLEENKKEKSLDYVKVRDYCKRLFEFKVVNVKKFTNWAERRKHEQAKKLALRPSLPESTKLITCAIPKNSVANVAGKSFKKEFVMNPAGKSHVCILHEYVQHSKRTQPKYRFKELENVSKPYCATVYIGDVEYGNGYGSSKKEAKTEAARASLSILIPDLKDTNEKEEKKAPSLNDLSFFDDISIEDQRVSELCLKAGQYSPYQILVECKKRSHGIKDMNIQTEVSLIKHQRIEFKMTVGEYTAKVICKNKREGKQRAAQKILKLLYPDVKSWGSMLKLYGQGSCKTSKEKKEEAQKITELQNNACSNRPNYDILNKLKEEMLKLRQRNLSCQTPSETVLTSLTNKN